jgi:hypothetical protein
MTDTGQDDGLFFGRWLREAMDARKIVGGAELARLISDHLGRDVGRSVTGAWLSKPRTETISLDYMHALAAVLLQPVAAVILAEARGRGAKVEPAALLAASLPPWTNELPTEDIDAVMKVFRRLGVAHGLTT